MNSSFEDKESDLSGDEELDLSEDEGIYPHKDEQFDPSKYEEFYPLHHRYRGFSMTIMCLNNQFPYRKLFGLIPSQTYARLMLTRTRECPKPVDHTYLWITKNRC